MTHQVENDGDQPVEVIRDLNEAAPKEIEASERRKVVRKLQLRFPKKSL